MLTLTVACAATMGLFSTPAGGATGATVVGATVVPSITIDTTGCETSASTDLGIVPHGTTEITDSCTLSFSGGAATSRMLLSQVDGDGAAMYRLSDGTLDTSFAGTGAYIGELGDDDSQYSTLNYAHDGSLLAAGIYEELGTTYYDVTHLNADGSPRTAFGTNGVVTRSGGDDWAMTDATMDSAGRIMVSGARNEDAALIRLLPDGSFDPDFGGAEAGVAAFDHAAGTTTGNDNLYWTALETIDSSGDYIAVGATFISAGRRMGCVIARIDQDGDLVTTWGTDGGFTILDPTPSSDQCNRAVASPDGSFYVSGAHLDTGGNFTGALLARFTPDGQLDTTFDGGVVDPLPAASLVYYPAISVQPDGKPVVAVSSVVAPPQMFAGNIVRFDLDGTYDDTFAGDGDLMIPISDPLFPTSIAVEPNGGLLVGSAVLTSLPDTARPALFRINSDGSTGPGLGPDGYRIFDNTNSMSWALALGTNGQVATTSLLAAATYTERSIQAFTTHSTTQWGDGSWASGDDTFAACLEGVDDGAAGGPGLGWTVAGATCVTATPGSWNAVPETSGDSGALVATGGPSGGEITLRFGFHAASNQPPGAYVAPLRFEILAPL